MLCLTKQNMNCGEREPIQSYADYDYISARIVAIIILLLTQQTESGALTDRTAVMCTRLLHYSTTRCAFMYIVHTKLECSQVIPYYSTCTNMHTHDAC